MKGRVDATKFGQPAASARRALLGLAFLLGACVVSPQPSPPATEPDLDGDQIGVFGEGTEDFTELLTFDAAPKTVEPAEGIVIVTNLDRADAPSVVAVRNDGSFSIALNGFPGDTFRFQVDQDGVRSQPVDIAVDATGTQTAVVNDEPSCLRIEPARYLALESSDSTRQIIVKNNCDDTVRIAAPRLRRGRGPFTFSPTQSFQLAPDEAAFITIRASGDADETEDVLFLDVLEPTVAVRAITLTVPE